MKKNIIISILFVSSLVLTMLSINGLIKSFKDDNSKQIEVIKNENKQIIDSIQFELTEINNSINKSK
jgi:hypothetical protein